MKDKKEKKKQGFLAKLIGKPSEEEDKPKESGEILKQGKITTFQTNEKGVPEQLKYELIIETMQGGVEGNYYWMQRFMRSKNPSFGLGMELIKVRDIFTAGEASSFWGNLEQRKGLQQDKVSQFLATIGKLIKDTFQIVREMHIIDERLRYYDDYHNWSKTRDEEAESGVIALKGTWIDLVEGGSKNPASVYGLAQQVGFATLPDLFFTIHPSSANTIKKEVNTLKKVGINRKVREVLARKLKQFLEWKDRTEKEIRQRRIFVLKYLRMHFNNIKLYTTWIKPYLRAIKALQSGFSADTPEVSAAFESTELNLELIGYIKKYATMTEEGYEEPHEFKKYFPSLLLKFRHIAMPMMSYQKELQRGPIHAGRTEITIIPLVLTIKQMHDYKDLVERKDLEEVEDLIPSLHDSLSALGPELDKYLEEAGEEIRKEKKEDEESDLNLKNVVSPFTNVFKGVKEIFSSKKSEKGEEKISKKQEDVEKAAAKSIASRRAFTIYDVYKKAHGMLAE
ncbi:MAG: hypothetical protein AABW46_01550 [Nanoarchaeota archaeon]